MATSLTREQRSQLLKDLNVGNPPSPDDIRKELEHEWLRPSRGARKEMSEPHWAAHWSRPTDIRSLLHIEPTFPTTSLEFKSSGLNGEITGYKEVTHAAQTRTALNSTSIDRQPTSSGQASFIRGKSSYFPFKPGGLAADVGLADDDARDATQAADSLEKAFERGRGGIKTIPPGFTRGLDFGPVADDEDGELLEEQEHIEVTPIYRPMLDASKPVATGRAPAQSRALDPAIDELLPAERLPKLPTTTSTAARRKPVVAKRDWAHVVDVNRELVNFRDLVPDMAKEYPFELDTFQKEAIYHMEVGESVFVAAHTSAGKTVVAEYAIALAARHMTKAIYTSPIKALSNQKFRDFQKTFDPSQVGILTGDVQINPEASCLIMTTEILRSMLYKGADLIRDVEWVIFDEVHYVNDLERGVVWEEVIIMLPDHVNIILLSATVPNTKEFADWVGRTKKKDIYVISTPKRPVPLEHFLYSGKELHKIVDSCGQFLGQGYKEAGEAIKRKQEKEREAAGLTGGPGGRGGATAGRGGPGARGGGTNRGGGGAARAAAVKNQAVMAARSGMKSFGGGSGGLARNNQSRDATLWIHLVGMLKKKELLPVVVFTFSKKRCEEYASSMPNTDLCTASEKSEVHVTIERSLTRLKGSDKLLPQIQNMRQLLSRGIGVHHGGLLPIVKEIVELLFARGLVKVLFATETFAMGVNMPAKSVVFSGIRKHDGRNFRELLAGEYTQMSGRAGRRGLDKTGTVIIVAENEVPETTTLTTMLLGQPTKLQSQFRLTYSMILNLLRVEALRVEEMIKRSFSENAAQRLLPDQQKKVAEGEAELRSLSKLESGPKRDELERYYDLCRRIIDLNTRMLEGVLAHPSSGKMLSTGRVIVLSDGHFRDHPAVLLKSAPFAVTPSGVIDQTRQFYVLAFAHPDVRACKNDVPTESVAPRWPPHPPTKMEEPLTYELAIVPITSIMLVTSTTIKVDAEEIAERHRRSLMEKALADYMELIKGGTRLQEMDWNKVRGLEFRESLHERDVLAGKLGFMATNEPDFDEMYQQLYGERMLQEKIATLRMAISDQNLELLPDYEQRIDVLKELQFIDENQTVLLKGRVACEINSASELVLTELILDNFFATYEPEEIVALLSAFIFQEKTDNEPLLTPRLEEGRAVIEQVSDRVLAVQTRHRANFADEGFNSNGELKWGLTEPFNQITALTDVQEGTIVRTITRLDETCREVRDAARIVGNSDLFNKMVTCQEKIRRDVVFCASLYF
ncbi:Antiviral helicase ski2 [Microbotryomycetes sp. JL221]|nr:Antiviral helicase ski2 [Microbotryomycetes sp. JL221]